MTAEFLSSIAGIVLSLLFSHIPGLRAWYDAFAPDIKRLVMLGLLVLVAAGIYGVSCAGWYPLVACDQAGAKQLIELFVMAAVANQATYLLAPKGEAQPAG